VTRRLTRAWPAGQTGDAAWIARGRTQKSAAREIVIGALEGPGSLVPPSFGSIVNLRDRAAKGPTDTVPTPVTITAAPARRTMLSGEGPGIASGLSGSSAPVFDAVVVGCEAVADAP
jgi:hypothetical protein